MLKAIQSSTNLFQVDVTASDGVNSVTQSIDITIVDDPTNHLPFLTDIPPLQLVQNGTLQFQLPAIDVEGDDISFQAISTDPGATVSVDESGMLTVIPPTDFQGELEIIAVAYNGFFSLSRADRQSFFVTVVPEPSSLTLLVFGTLMPLALRRRR